MLVMTTFTSCEPTAGRHCVITVGSLALTGEEGYRTADTLSMTSSSRRAHCPGSVSLVPEPWVVSPVGAGLSCTEASVRPPSAETTEPQKPWRRNSWTQKAGQDWEDWRLWVLVTAQRLLLYLWICNCRAGSERSGTGVDQHPAVMC